ncbi:sensor histidine kinase [Nocardioides sp.]|jgi:two-component system sensor histidine kinase UhpB|uniref:sensor histidine kinase n=1 Tax=Nocardioides sp. TaxID=35761 RepID=UPI002F428AFC
MTTARTTDLEGRQPRPASHREFARTRRSSLYVRVVVVNAAILLVGLLLLLWSPVTVSAPVSVRQAIVLVAAAMVLGAADAALLKFSFTGLVALVNRMETLDLLRPRDRLPEMGGAETRALIGGFNTMLDRLEAERRASTRRSVATLEGERERISRELHDEIGQRMTGILLHLGPIHDEVPETARPRIVAVQDEARAVIDEIGALAWRMRPAILDHLGLVSALTALTESLGGHGPARIETMLPPRLPPMGHEAELAIYRIAQEALTNAVRHSGATTITVRMQSDETELVLQIADDGDALPDAGADGPGLRGMRERALLIGGLLNIEANPGRGLRVALTVPTGHLGG